MLNYNVFVQDYERELRIQETEDLKEYQIGLENKRRESLAYRLQQAKKGTYCTYMFSFRINSHTSIFLHKVGLTPPAYFSGVALDRINFSFFSNFETATLSLVFKFRSKFGPGTFFFFWVRNTFNLLPNFRWKQHEKKSCSHSMRHNCSNGWRSFHVIFMPSHESWCYSFLLQHDPTSVNTFEGVL